jgi:hypothetical protein
MEAVVAYFSGSSQYSPEKIRESTINFSGELVRSQEGKRVCPRM